MKRNKLFDSLYSNNHLLHSETRTYQLNKLQEIKNIEKIFKLVKEFFGGDRVKTSTWMQTKNHLLGDVEPWQMILSGRINRLLAFVENQLKENELPKTEDNGKNNNSK